MGVERLSPLAGAKAVPVLPPSGVRPKRCYLVGAAGHLLVAESRAELAELAACARAAGDVIEHVHAFHPAGPLPAREQLERIAWALFRDGGHNIGSDLLSSRPPPLMTELVVQPLSLRPFFTPKSLAAYLTLSERTVRGLIARGDIASYKIAGSRRIDPADVDSWLAGRRTERGRTQRA